VRRLAAQHGSDVLAATSAALIDYTAQRTREAIAAMPDGTYRASGFVDDDGITAGVPLPVEVAATVDGDRLIVDFTGTAAQIDGGMNCPVATTRSVVHYGLKCLLPDDIPFNDGAVKPVEIVLPPSSLVNPDFPAAVGDRHHTSMRVADTLVAALSQVVPERGSAGWFCGVPATIIETRSNKTGEASVLLSIIAGGAGASLAADGADAVDAHMSNCALIPAEVIESTYPLRVERYALLPDSGGAGRFRGGLGMAADFRVLEDERLSIRVETEQGYPEMGAPGLDGGARGANAEVWLLRDGEATPMPPKSAFEAQRGDVVSVRSGGGGGLGDPRSRDRAMVAADVRSGRVSEQAARELFGRPGATQ
jgi:N-methylhydantoinase B